MNYCDVEQEEAKVILDISNGSIDISDISNSSGFSHPCRKTWCPCGQPYFSIHYYYSFCPIFFFFFVFGCHTPIISPLIMSLFFGLVENSVSFLISISQCIYIYIYGMNIKYNHCPSIVVSI